MTIRPWAGAAGFALWGLLHIAGGGLILARAFGDPDAGFAFYRTAAPPYDALAGAILSYFAFALVAAGTAALAIAITGNLRNGATALLSNTALVAATEIGLVLFLLVPGHLGWADALPGFVLAAAGIVFGGAACRRGEARPAAG